MNTVLSDWEEGVSSLTLLDGKKVAGLAGHLVARYDYRTPPSQNALATIEALSRKYLKTETHLAPRIARMKEELSKVEFEADIAGAPATKPTAILVVEMTVKGKTYKNVRASSMRDGKFQFIHDEGAFSLPALPLPQSFLIKVAQSSPDIAGTYDFQNLMTTYVTSVSISGKSVKGARILKKEGEKLIVETDNGLHTIEESALTPSDLVKLESAGKRLANLSRKFTAAQERQVKAQDEYFAQVEQEKLARYRIEQKASADEEEIIEGERKIREELAEQKAARAKAESAAQAALWAGLGWLVLSALSDGINTSPSPSQDQGEYQRDFAMRQEQFEQRERQQRQAAADDAQRAAEQRQRWNDW